MKKVLLFICTFYALQLAWAQNSRVKDMKILVNGGNTYTVSTTVSIKVEAVGAVKMKICNEIGCSGIPWQEFKENVPEWVLPGDDGEKTVYAKFQDQNGMESAVIAAKIILDRVPPSAPSVKIIAKDKNKPGLTANRERTVDLQIASKDGVYMMVSNNEGFFAARWQAFRADIKDWKLEGDTDGLKKVYVKFRDHAGNVSEIAADQITVDTQAPLDGQVLIDYNREVTVDSLGRVRLSIFARGASEMMISNKADFSDAKWQPYATVQFWKLVAEQGVNKVYVKFRDEAGNEATAVAGEDIVVDGKAPAVYGIQINNGAVSTSHPDRMVELSLKAKEAKFMIISNTLDFAGARWVAYETKVSKWKLNGSGLRTVYVRFKDANGNETPVYSASITAEK